jgi:hypothetical protein
MSIIKFKNCELIVKYLLKIQVVIINSFFRSKGGYPCSLSVLKTLNKAALDLEELGKIQSHALDKRQYLQCNDCISSYFS